MTTYEVYGTDMDRGRETDVIEERSSLKDALSLAGTLLGRSKRPADVFAVQYAPSMPSAGRKTLHQWRVSEKGVTQIS